MGSVRHNERLYGPEPDDGTLLADVALGLVLGGLGSGDSVQNGQPHHGLGLQAHPVQEHGGFQLGFVIGLGEEGGGKGGGGYISTGLQKKPKQLGSV